MKRPTEHLSKSPDLKPHCQRKLTITSPQNIKKNTQRLYFIVITSSVLDKYRKLDKK